MRLQLNLHRVPTIIPIWVMILFFRQHRYLCHKGKGLTEVFKGKGAAKEPFAACQLGGEGCLVIYQVYTRLPPIHSGECGGLWWKQGAVF